MAPDDATRRRQTALAGHLADEAQARRGLDDPSAQVRAAALGALSRMNRLTAADIVRGAGDDAAVVRRRACELSPVLAGTAGVEEMIVRALDDGDVLVVDAACYGLGELAGAVGLDTVRALTRTATAHTDPLAREAAVAALGAIGHPEGLPAILAATSDKPAIRRRAVLALAPFEGPEVDEALARAAQDRDWQVRQAAEDVGGETA
jgi:hypothetical protein